MCFSLHLDIHSYTVFVVELRGVINLPAASYVQRALRDAEERRTSLVVIEMDTPGGLDPSMRKIIQDFLSSPVPLAVSLEGSSFFSLQAWITSPPDSRISPWQVRGATTSMGPFMLSIVAQMLRSHKASLRNGPAQTVAHGQSGQIGPYINSGGDDD